MQKILLKNCCLTQNSLSLRQLSKIKEETYSLLFLYNPMENTLSIPEMLQQILQETDCYLVSQKVDKANNFKFFIDNDGDFKIADCIKINRKLRNMVDESDLYPEGNYSLEISSPGVEEPLLHSRQYLKNIGRLVEVTQQDATIKPQIGRLTAVTETNISLEIGKQSNNKAIKTLINTSTIIIEFTNIKQAVIQIEF